MITSNIYFFFPSLINGKWKNGKWINLNQEIQTSTAECIFRNVLLKCIGPVASKTSSINESIGSKVTKTLVRFEAC